MSSGLRGVDHDPGKWGHSLANLNELLFVVLETAGVRSIAEIGAYAGDFTRDLADFAEARGGEVLAVDPDPQPALDELADSRSSIELIREPSDQALAHTAAPTRSSSTATTTTTRSAASWARLRSASARRVCRCC